MSKTLWSVKFQSNNFDFGSGVVAIDGDQVYGGDHGYYYVGKCTISGNSATAIVTVTKHNPTVTSVFGNIQTFNLVLTGNVVSNTISFTGNVEGQPAMKMTATMQKLVNLA